MDNIDKQIGICYSVFSCVMGGRNTHEVVALWQGDLLHEQIFILGREVRKSMKASDEIFEKKQNLVHEILRTRREMGMTQKNIEAACGVKQPVIARMERGLTDPQLTTILKVLRPLGKTLKIVDIEEDSDK